MFELNAAPWIGGRRDPEDRDNWRWSDGSAWDYTYWAAGTPNDAGGVEDCARMYEDNDLGQWNDKVCNDKRTFVCKKGKNTSNIKGPNKDFKTPKKSYHLKSGLG